VLVWLALMALAAITLVLSGAHFGNLDIVFSLVIAVVKAVLVMLFFMELIEHRFVNSMIVVISAGFVVLLVGLTVADIITRHTFPKGPLPPPGETVVHSRP
jgi:cytochrome c oxidase subunit 4